LTDPVRTPDPAALAQTLFEGCGIIYRHFGADDRTYVAETLAEIARKKNLVVLIGNDPDLAKQVGADGVHWPEARLAAASEWVNTFKLMTAAAHTQQAIEQTQALGLDAALVSPVFPSESPSAGLPIGPETLCKWADSTDLPLYGLGGVDAENITQIHDFAGAAMIGGLQAAIKNTD